MNRIKELRKKENLTLKALGEALKMRDNTLSRYENEKRIPKSETWQALADFFNVSVAYLQGFYHCACCNKDFSLLEKEIPSFCPWCSATYDDVKF
ncbi:helix-turn-helix transcriptional regulator [Lactobacillus sp.]|uniref:helix-turn-helix domain-containing protein n=1 Tax=Lactobacillus sp. TaxID=1591 RepID=UPI0019C055B5|nr:helix-turn-helix transcriptional regulator [Lactobacillus sp.]MBD5429331.1 helix-turn-helix transcriptional regulator [Lactobacillus sp.]MBD5430012.1 helix-turn-helix transcriptional regulator [Lactobacillus sp.]